MHLRSLLVFCLTVSLVVASVPAPGGAQTSLSGVHWNWGKATPPPLAKPAANAVRRTLDDQQPCTNPDGCKKNGGLGLYLIPIVLAVGAIAYFALRRPQTVASEPTPVPTGVPPTTERTMPPTSPPTTPPTAPPTQAPTSPPTVPPPSFPPYTPVPSPSPTQIACTYEPLDGWFEPTQAVWQDDSAFPDQAGKQITKSAKFRPVPSYDAELKMIADRDTVLFGMDYYVQGGARQSAPGHSVIALEYRSNCSKTVDVHFVFTLEQGKTTVYPDPRKLKAYLQGPPNPNGAFHTYRLSIAVPKGLPPEGVTPFLLETGDYRFVAEIKLAADNSDSRSSPSPLRVIVFDSAIQTHAPSLHFIPTILDHVDDKHDYTALENKLKADTAALAETSHLAIPDYFPVPNDDQPVALAELKRIDASRTRPNAFSTAWRIIAGEIGGFVTGHGAIAGATLMLNERREQLLREIIIDDADTKAFTENAGRAIVVLPKYLYGLMMPAGTNGKYSGEKVIVVPQDTEHWEVAHEVAHSIPLPGWDGSAANAECRREMHNLQPTIKIKKSTASGKALAGLGNGARLRTLSAREGRAQIESDLHYFGATDTTLPADTRESWTDQCTYWHLANNLQKPQDPRVLLVRGFLFNHGGRYGALIGPSYTYDADRLDLTRQGHGRWAIVLRSGTGAVLARYRFEPAWYFQDTHTRRQMRHFAYRIPADDRAAFIEVTAPDGTLTRLRTSARPPSVSVSEPAASFALPNVPGSVPVRWTASGERGRPLFSSVLYSSDRGQNWLTSEHEIDNTSGHVPVYRGQERLWIKVLVSDGSRSTESTVLKFGAP